MLQVMVNFVVLLSRVMRISSEFQKLQACIKEQRCFPFFLSHRFLVILNIAAAYICVIVEYYQTQLVHSQNADSWLQMGS